MFQVSGLVALLQDPAVDVLLLDLRDEDDFAQYHVTGGISSVSMQCVPAVLVACECLLSLCLCSKVFAIAAYSSAAD